MINFFNDFDNEPSDETPHIMPIFTEIKGGDGEGADEVIDVNNMPILALRNMVLFPGITLPVAVGRSKSLKLIQEAQENKSQIGVVCQVNGKTEDPGFDDLHHYGVVADIIKIFELPDNTTNVLLQGRSCFELKSITVQNPYLKGVVELSEEIQPAEDDKEFDALMISLRELTFDILKNMGDGAKELAFAIKNIDNPLYLINFLSVNCPIEPSVKQEMLEERIIKQRAYKLYSILSKQAQLLAIKADIQSKTREDLSQQQREHFLQQQIRTIQDELGNTADDDIDELQKRAEKKHWNEETGKAFEKELKKLERINPQSPDFSVQYAYLDTLLNLPWNEYTTDNFNLKKVEAKLNKDHYGLEKVKDRILEHLAVLKLRGDMKAPIICLYGPPGVGKTSLGKSIADALNRKYVRVSLGGLHDEAEIRGHRRTYIGAMPGRIIQGLIKSESANPVFVLDEIDKLGQDFKGDPSSALLEVLDPEQNSHFHDNYVEID